MELFRPVLLNTQSPTVRPTCIDQCWTHTQRFISFAVPTTSERDRTSQPSSRQPRQENTIVKLSYLFHISTMVRLWEFCPANRHWHRLRPFPNLFSPIPLTAPTFGRSFFPTTSATVPKSRVVRIFPCTSWSERVQGAIIILECAFADCGPICPRIYAPLSYVVVSSFACVPETTRSRFSLHPSELHTSCRFERIVPHQ